MTQFRHTFLLLLLFTASAGIEAQEKLQTIPAQPERGKKVTIRYNPAAPGSTIAPSSQTVEMVFTYSNLYEFPWRIPMHKKGDVWEFSFVVPRYATYATFYLQSGDAKDMPAANKHFEFAVYDQGKRVQNGYLYENYSLQAQIGKAPDLEERKAALLEKELQLYPDNYEAKLRLLNYKIAKADAGSKENLRNEARSIIAAKFMENPGNMGLMNKTTMGYLIIGENSRLDSIRKVVSEKFPETEVGYSQKISEISQETDSIKMAAQLHELLKKENAENYRFFSSAHERLFRHYAARKETEKALFHLGKMNADFTPYTPEELKERAEVLLNAEIALEKALQLAKHSLTLADTFPVGIIRHFPETGHIPSYVSPEARKEATAKATANLKSIISLIRMKQGFEDEAESAMEEALALSSDVETLANAGKFYWQTNRYDKAFQAYKSIMMKVPEDTFALSNMKKSYISKNNSSSGWDAQMEELNSHWRKEMTAQLQKEIINLPTPDFLKSIVDIKGKPVRADLIKNKIVIVDFWATWCVPCMKEMPYVDNAFQKYKNNKDVLFMIVNSGSNNTLKDAQGWWGNEKYNFPVFYNSDRNIGQKFGFNVIPATYIIDKKGNIRFKTIGFEGPVIQRKIEGAIEMLKKES